MVNVLAKSDVQIELVSLRVVTFLAAIFRERCYTHDLIVLHLLVEGANLGLRCLIDRLIVHVGKGAWLQDGSPGSSTSHNILLHVLSAGLCHRLLALNLRPDELLIAPISHLALRSSV